MLTGSKSPITTAWWYRYFQSHDSGQPPSNETTVTPKGSPYTYTAPRGGILVVNGGTIASIQMARSGTFYPTGVTSGSFSLAQNDKLLFTYSVAPQLVFFPT
jgi:hypothetical protein